MVENPTLFGGRWSGIKRRPVKAEHAARSTTELAPCGWRESNPRPRCPVVPPAFAGSIGAGWACGQRQKNRHIALPTELQPCGWRDSNPRHLVVPVAFAAIPLGREKNLRRQGSMKPCTRVLTVELRRLFRHRRDSNPHHESGM
ncbi:hypothetical protein C4K26_2317 [Pseudomonas chlororaphis]|nr:hypothetical protein C4K26_2317 [Pseudomonas chlororaphis]